MQITVTVGGQGTVVVPEAVVERLRLEPGAQVDIHIAQHKQRSVGTDPRFNAMFAKYRDVIREQGQGHASLDDCLEALPPSQ